MPYSSEIKTVPPNAQKNNGDREQGDGERFEQNLLMEGFLLQVVERATLHDFAQALNSGDIQRAKQLAIEDTFSLAHDIDQLRVKDIFPNYPDQTALQSAETCCSEALTVLGDLWEKERQKQTITEHNLRQLLDAARTLYDDLEQMIPPHARKKFIDEARQAITEYMKQNQDHPELEAVKGELDLLSAAEERLK